MSIWCNGTVTMAVVSCAAWHIEAMNDSAASPRQLPPGDGT